MAQHSREKATDMRTHVLKLREAGAIGRWLRRRHSPVTIVAASLFFLSATVVFVWISPWIVGFTAALGTAAIWCWWLAGLAD